MMHQAMDAAQIDRLKHNIFPLSWNAVEPAESFAWHKYRSADGTSFIDSFVPQSSQALAIDVFGWIKLLPRQPRDSVMNSLACVLGLKPSCDWEIELEWQDPLNTLHETPHTNEYGQVEGVTQVDVLASSYDYVLCIECKFTEGLGKCGQMSALGGPAQCNGY